MAIIFAALAALAIFGGAQALLYFSLNAGTLTKVLLLSYLTAGGMLGITIKLTTYHARRHAAETIPANVQQANIKAELVRSEARFRELANSMPHLVSAATASGEFTYYSQDWQSLTGIARMARNCRRIGRCFFTLRIALAGALSGHVRYRARRVRTERTLTLTPQRGASFTVTFAKKSSDSIRKVQQSFSRAQSTGLFGVDSKAGFKSLAVC